MAGELILIVEDNEKNRILFRDILQTRRYRTLEAATGEDALAVLQKERPDLILIPTSPFCIAIPYRTRN